MHLYKVWSINFRMYLYISQLFTNNLQQTISHNNITFFLKRLFADFFGLFKALKRSTTTQPQRAST